MGSTVLLLGRRIPAGRAVQCIIADSFIPWSKTGADFWFCFMDPAVDLPVIRSAEERT